MKWKAIFIIITILTIFFPCRFAPAQPLNRTETKEDRLLLSINDSIRLVLKNSLDLLLEKQNPMSLNNDIISEKAKFDPSLSLEAKNKKNIRPSASALEAGFGAAEIVEIDENNIDLNIGLKQNLLTGGNYELQFNNNRFKTSTAFQILNPSFSSNLNLTITQPLLKGFGIDVSRTQIRIASNNLTQSRYSLEEKVMDLVLDTYKTYWDLVFNIENLKIQQQLLGSANDLLNINRIKVDLGTLAPIEILVAEAGAASREENVVLAEKNVKDAEDRLKRLMNPPEHSLLESYSVIPVQQPSLTKELFNLDEVIKIASEERPDIKKEKIDLDNKKITYNQAKNEIFPSLDLKGSAGLNGLGANYSDNIDEFKSKDFYTWEVDLIMNIPIGNRSAKAKLSKQAIEIEKAKISLKNTEQKVVVDIKEAIRRIDTDLKRIESTKKARILAEKKLLAEQERFNVGLSNSREILRFQDDLADARSKELAAIIDYNKSLADMERVKGTILKSNQISFEDYK